MPSVNDRLGFQRSREYYWSYPSHTIDPVIPNFNELCDVVTDFTDEELRGFLDETLPAERLAELERTLRSSDSLKHRLANVARQRDDGTHSVGAIWRRLRLTCPSRSELGGFLLGTLDTAQAQYIEFHIKTVGCRYCAANMEDLQQAADTPPAEGVRARKYFESSAGLLPKHPPDAPS